MGYGDSRVCKRGSVLEASSLREAYLPQNQKTQVENEQTTTDHVRYI